MKRLTTICAFSAVMMMAAPAFAGGSSSAGAEAGKQILTTPSNNHFGYALTREITSAELAASVNRNVFLSPASAAMAFQMLLNGAGGTTRTELASVLDLSTTPLDDVNNSAENLLSYLADLAKFVPDVPLAPGSPPPSPLTLTMANSAWSDAKGAFRFNPSFTSTLDRSFHAQTQSVDFAAPSGAAAINGWASDHTGGKIKNLIDQKTLSQLSFVLMNATYFKANWAAPFSPARTSQAKFSRGDASLVNVDMMSNELYGYSKVGNTEVMELPYEGGSSSMYVVLPEQGRALTTTLADPTGPLSENFWAQVAAATLERARFSMPKFSFSYDVPLTDSLKALGLKQVFMPGADLSALGTEPTYVSLAKQDTFISVDENGTEAAAVTTVTGAGAVAPVQRPIVMTVDRPFVIAIVEKTSNAVLFLGEISDPSAK